MQTQIQKTGSSSVTVPPGRYLLGDPCYSLGKRGVWLNACNEMEKQDEEASLNQISLRDRVYVVPLHERQIMAFNTYYGDGQYTDEKGNEYLVDSGMIGLVPMEFLEENGGATEEDLRPCHIVKFDEYTKCEVKDGKLIFGSTEIETGDVDDDLEEDLDEGWDD